MKISSSGIVDGAISRQYGKHGSQIENGVPTRSLPISFEDAPHGTVSYAVYMWDPDSKPVCGFEWVHWLSANIAEPYLPENASQAMARSMVQGGTDDHTNSYAGPQPPDKPHVYHIRGYALNAMLPLNEEFSLIDFFEAIDGHVLAECEITGSYDD